MGNKAAHDEMLTEEELAALADDEAGEDPSEAAPPDDVATPQEAEAAKEGEADASPEGKQEEAKAEAEPEAASQADAPKPDATVAEPTPEPDPVAAAQPEAAAGDDDIAKSIPHMTWQVPADYPEKIAAGEKTLDELAEKFDNGELLASEYRQQARAVQNEIDNLKKIVDRAETREEDAKQTWYEACEEFIGKNPAYASPGPMRQMLDAEVRRLQEELGARGRNYLHASVLEIAATNIKRSAAELLGVQVSNDTQAKPQGKNAAPEPKAPAAVVKPQTKEPVPTLSAVPVSAEDDIESGEFAYLNRLSDKDWPAYERELEKLQRTDPEKYNAYMAYMN